MTQQLIMTDLHKNRYLDQPKAWPMSQYKTKK